MRRFILTFIILLISIIGYTQELTSEYLNHNLKKEVKRIAKKQIKIWIRINKSHCNYLSDIKMGKFQYFPYEGSFDDFIGKESDSIVEMNVLTPILCFNILCRDSNGFINKEIVFSFNAFGQFSDIVLYDYTTKLFEYLYLNNSKGNHINIHNESSVP